MFESLYKYINILIYYVGMLNIVVLVSLPRPGYLEEYLDDVEMLKYSNWNIDLPRRRVESTTSHNSFSCQEVCNMNLKTGYFIGKQDWWKPSFSHLQSQQHQHQHNSNSSLEGFSVDIAELINCGAINKRGGSTYWKYYYLLYWLTDSLQDNGLFFKDTTHNVKGDIMNDIEWP